MIAILYNIRSMHNVGSIFRTADAAGVEKIYLCGITPAPVDKFGRARTPISKTALGAEKYVEWEYIKSVPLLLDKFKKQGYMILAVEQSKKSIPYYKFNLPSIPSFPRRGRKEWFRRPSEERKDNSIALALGNEIKGLSPAILKRADKILEIPMRGKKESLNVAVAFGVVIFHLINSAKNK